MIRRSYIKLSGIISLVIATTLIGVAFFLPRLIDVNAYRDDVITLLQKGLNRPVTFSNASFNWHFGPSFIFNDVVVKDKDTSVPPLLSAGKITVNLALLPLLEKKMELKDLALEQATISLQRNADGTLSIDDLLKKPGKDSLEVQIKKVRLKQGTIVWKDLAQPHEPFSLAIRNISLNLSDLSRGHKGSLKLSCDLPGMAGGYHSQFSLSGSVRMPREGIPLKETELNLETDLRQLEISRFWPYYGRFIPFDNCGGRLDVAGNLKGKIQDFSSKGKIRINGAAATWPAVFHYTVAPRTLSLDYAIKFNKKLIDVSTFELGTEGFRIKGNLQLHDYLTKDPRILVRANTPSTFRYEDVRSYVPYGILPENTTNYIEHKIKSGVFKLDSGVLDGRFSQITHMEVGDNCNTLMVRGPVEKATLSYGPKAPAFNNIKGTIELKGKNFNLIGMTGNFGASPFKLNGSITEYNTDKSSDYPVRMEIIPQSPEVAWLARIAGATKLDYNGTSALTLNGSGHYSAYRLNGEWDLKQAAYNYPGAVRKPVGMTNNLNFSSVIGNGETRLTSVSYSLPPLSMSANAILKYGDTPYLGFELQTNMFSMGENLPILSMWQQFRPRGKAQAHIKGSGNPEDFSAMDYNGTVTLSGFSVQPGEKFKNITGINGRITFKGNSLETSSVTARYGASQLTLKGRVRSLHNHEAELSVSSPELFLHDFNTAINQPDVAIKRFNSTLSLREGTYTLKSVSGLINDSNFSVSGNYTGGPTPSAILNLTSTKLDLDDLRLVSAFDNQVEGNAKGTDVKLNLAVETGKYGKLQFGKLNAVAQQDGGVIYLQSLNATLFGGKLAAKGRIAPGGPQGKRYDLNIKMERIDADKLFHALEISREVTGSLTVNGDLTARGDSMADIKKSALGNVRLQMKNGKLRKFNTLSKVFSILNVSQLLKGQLPDMVSGGMPYNDINGSIAIKDGIVSSQDIFINSNAINISVIGKADIVREDLDFTIGVQPLQTVDKLVNRIPVVGWLLTGNDKSFLTAYFEAKGKWADPQVSAIPVKSLSKGALNIFRRVFELPVRLFTDTGEVVLGQ